jgi:hypothetical protein
MATYPDDATVSLTAFGTVGLKTYNSTGSDIEFPLPSTVSFVGDVIVTIDGIVQDVSSYYLSNSGGSVTFIAAPNATELVFKTIDLPTRFRATRSYPAVYVASYSNTSATTIDSNTYLLNGVQTSFSLPTPALGNFGENQANSIFVTLSGVLQNQDAFTYPSATLGVNGIDFPEAPAIDDGGVDYANTTLEIRTLIPQVDSIGRFTDMRDRKPSNGFSIDREFSTKKYESQSGYEKRRLMSRRSRRTFELTYNNISGVEKQAIEDFYTARNGDFETFTFDLAHINSAGTVRTRFDGPIQIEQVISGGSALTQNFYSVQITLKEDFS